MASHTFTRQELYDLAWSVPMTKLGERFGISGRGLAKACERAAIPVPERGYWAKVQAGQKVEKTPLPVAGHSAMERVTISPPGPQTPPPLPPAPPASVHAKIEEELGPEMRVTVPPTLSSPHRIVAGWLEENRRKQREVRGDPWRSRLYEPIDKTKIAKRRLRILSTIFDTLEARGYKLVVDDPYRYQVLIALKDERLAITLEERQRQFRRYLTDAEKAERGDLSTGRRWTQEKEPTGELVLRIKEAGGWGHAKEWRDAPDAPLEVQVNAVLGGIAGAFEEIRLRREREAEARHRQHELEEQRRKREMERKREIIRFSRLIRRTEDWNRAAQIRALVAAIEASPRAAEEIETFSQWKKWALGHADRIDPLRSGDLFNLAVSDMEAYMLREQ